MHSLQALALMQEKRIANVGSRWTRIQRSPSSTDWPGSNGTSWISQRPEALSRPRQILSLACPIIALLSPVHGRFRQLDNSVAEPNNLIAAPFCDHAGKILTLVRAPALGAPQRRGGDGACDEQHVSQIEPIEPLRVEGLAITRRTIAEIACHLIDVAERALEFWPCAQRSDIVLHRRSQHLHHPSGI